MAAPSLLGVWSPPSPQPALGLLHASARRLQLMAGRLAWLLRDRALLAGWWALTALMFAIATLQRWLLAHSASDTIRPDAAWTAYAGIASLLPLGPGAADGSMAALLRRMGMTFEQAPRWRCWPAQP